MMTRHVAEMADYNRWANRRLYADAATLPPAAQQRDVGIYFKSLFATLAHLLATDRAWTFLLRGGTLADMRLPPPPVDFPSLVTDREDQDRLFVAWLGAVDEAWLAEPYRFTSALGSLKGMTFDGTRASTLAHLFNHQAHHRGQAHAALTILGVPEPQGLDILIKGFLRE